MFVSKKKKKKFCLDRQLKLSAEGCQDLRSYCLITVLSAATGPPLEFFGGHSSM